MTGRLKTWTKHAFRLCGLEIKRFAPYKPYGWLKGKGIRTVLDVGANTGQFATMIQQALPEARVYSFEPLGECCEQLRKTMEGVSGFQAFDFALGETNGQAQIYRNDATPSSSLLPMAELHKEAFPFAAQAQLETIKIRRLDDVIHDLEIVDDVLIKVDVQGTEDKVIAGGEETFSRASVLILETTFVPLYQGQSLFDAIYDRLRAKGFTYMGTEHIIRDPRDGRVLQCDSLFLREPFDQVHAVP
jgi:FkbM family methyltransferase